MFTLHPQLIADTFPLGDLDLSRVLVVNDANFPWLILVPRRENIHENYQLNLKDQQQLLLESNTIGKLLMAHFKGDKLNVAALGNIVSQLHIHLVVRYKNDLAWPRPVWGTYPAKAYQEDQRQTLINELTNLISTQMRISSC